ncbi:Oxidoreductase, FAD-binding protein [Pseudomonas syringae pv. actinidiae]|uniref:Oxidoreductase, FAD-binding protein n=1 Tax=Pseudomonas syringae pv. actinidiae TaxID=103796 RepID=A0A7Z6U5N1_PSESF|nr:Oxidoreductase, FAD-binding protein [Pseudomonas syringae pv. actinidiae]
MRRSSAKRHLGGAPWPYPGNRQRCGKPRLRHAQALGRVAG